MNSIQQRLKEVFSYDPNTGLFTRILKTSNSAKSGISGRKATNGYLTIELDGRRIYAHRAAFLYMTGCFPQEDIDHINGTKMDNRWINLRPASRSQNMCNSIMKNSTLKGASWFERDKCWRARIQLDGRQTHLGYFNSEKEAHEAYITAAARLHKDFAKTS